MMGAVSRKIKVRWGAVLPLVDPLFSSSVTYGYGGAVL